MVAGGYDPLYFERLFAVEDRSFWFRARSDLINWAVDAYFPRSSSFLEIGCGTGYVVGRLYQRHPEWAFVGTELHEEGLEVARRRLPAEVALRKVDATDNPYNEEFDLAGAFDVIEHIEDAKEVLAGLRRAIRPGGGLVVTVPQHGWLWSEADVHAQHVRRYSARQLRSEMNDAGFTVLRMTSFVTLLLPLMVSSRLVPGKRRGVEGELSLPAPLNSALYTVMRLERGLIQSGVRLPLGGSLLAVARRP